MSLPPQYRRKLEDEESAPLYKNDERLSLDLESPEYPPRFGQSSAGHDDRQINVNYTFVPRYPVKGKPWIALGVLGRTKEETTQIVQRACPTLAEFPAKRIEYFALTQRDAANQAVNASWGVVMDEAWAGFDRCPPTHLKVQVQDGPGDESRRSRRTCLIITSIPCGVLAVYGLGFLLAWFLGAFEG